MESEEIKAVDRETKYRYLTEHHFPLYAVLRKSFEGDFHWYIYLT